MCEKDFFFFSYVGNNTENDHKKKREKSLKQDSFALEIVSPMRRPRVASWMVAMWLPAATLFLFLFCASTGERLGEGHSVLQSSLLSTSSPPFSSSTPTSPSLSSSSSSGDVSFGSSPKKNNDNKNTTHAAPRRQQQQQQQQSQEKRRRRRRQRRRLLLSPSCLPHDQQQSNSTSSNNNNNNNVINDSCSQAPAAVDASAANPLDSSKVIHARPWTTDEAIATALRRRGRQMTSLSDLDLAAASPLLLPDLVRYRPLSSPPEEPDGGEVARVMAAFSDGYVPYVEGGNPGFTAAQGGLSPAIAKLEARPADVGGGEIQVVRKTITPQGLRVLLSQPERVLIASE